MIRYLSCPHYIVTLSMALFVFCAFLPLSHAPVEANFGDPCAKYPKGSKKWKKCKTYRYQPGAFVSQDEQFMAGYWLAKNGHYRKALEVLGEIEAGGDPRVLNYIGYATRKLGHVSDALKYYRRALAIAPDYVVSRAYLGEALLSTGDVSGARHELWEIATRCGTSCEAYVSLKAVIDRGGAL